MLGDILTVMWKEWKSVFRYRGSRTRFLVTMLSPLVFAIYGPWEAGPAWVEEIPSVLFSAFIPVIGLALTVPDSFAGERERHTLETLLASRLPDRAILFGKMAVSIAFCWGLTWAFLLVSLVTVNAAHWGGRILFFSPIILLADLGLSFLMTLLGTCLGVLISLRSETVQQAAQTLVAVFLVPPMILQIPLFVSRPIREFITSLDGRHILYAVIGLLSLLSGILFAIMVSRFRRARLISD